MTAELLDDEWAAERAVNNGDTAKPQPKAPALFFPTLPAFVEHLTDWYRREVFDSTERIWCPDWWKHREAVIRLDALWRTLEAARNAEHGDGISGWLRDHADVHMAQLMQPHGPFRGCSARKGHAADPLPRLPVNPAPDNWWTMADSGL